MSANAQNLRIVGDSNSGAGCTSSDLGTAMTLAMSDPDFDEIRLTNAAMVYNNISLQISNQAITIKGGYETCADAVTDNPSANAKTILKGTTLTPVVSLISSGATYTVILERLGITGGKSDINSGQNGGGIFVNGDWQLSVIDSDIYGNAAVNNGGGIYLGDPDNSGADPGLILKGTRIYSNSALNGGGVYSKTFWGGQHTSITFEGDNQIDNNLATSSGGGLYILGSQESADDILSNAQTGNIKINNNEAGTGGGVYFSNVDFDLFYGGKLYLENNTANSGAALYLYLNSSLRSYGAVIQNNTMAGTSAYSGVVTITRGSVWSDKTLKFTNNISNSNMIYIGGSHSNYLGGVFCSNSLENDTRAFFVLDDANLRVKSALICQNTGGNTIVRTSAGTGDSSIKLVGSTVADNAKRSMEPLDTIFDMTGPDIGQSNSSTYSFYANIINNSATETLAYAGNVSPTFDKGCSIVEETATFPATFVRLITGDPQFQDANSMDYQPGLSSPAVDACEVGSIGTSLANLDDIIGNPRGIDIPFVANGPGHYDMGAYEVTDEVADDTLFKSGFESN